MKVLCVDGPKRGSAIDVDDGAKVWQVPIPRAIPLMPIAEQDQLMPNFDTVTYHIHYIAVFGEVIAVGTVRTGYPTSYNLGRSMLTSEARSAVRS